MKKIITKFHLALLCVICFGCSDLVEEPEGILAPESLFKSASDVEAAIIGAYAEYSSPDLYGRQLSLSLMLKSDMVAIGRNTAGDRIAINNFETSSENSLVRSIWYTFFRTISAANTAIQGAGLIDEEASVKAALEAEGRFVRAFGYYNLVRLFGDVPYLDGPVESAEQVESATRTPESEVYEAIIADLIFARDNLPAQHDGSVRNRATSGTAQTVLAEVYLTLGRFAEAATESKAVIANKGQFDYTLENDYQDLYNGDLAGNLSEPIFVIDFHNSTSDPDNNIDWLIPMTRVNGWAPRSLSVTVPSLEVYNTWDSNDYRRKVSFVDSLDFGNGLIPLVDASIAAPRPHIAKYFVYPGPQDGGDDRRGDNDYMVYRYADVLLIAAEAIAESSGVNSEAIGYIDELIDRANNNAFGLNIPNVNPGISTADFINLVREERRLELSFEFKRWFDIKRWGILDESFDTGSLEEHAVNSGRDYLFPIPQTEIDVTGFTQNPGY